MRLKIILLVHQFLPVCSAGTEILTYQTAKELQRRGHAVEVVAPLTVAPPLLRERPFYADEYDGLHVWRYRYNPYVTSPNKNMVEFQYNNLAFAQCFRDHVKELRPDVVHSFHFSKITASPIDVCTENDIPIVFTPTDFWAVCPTCQLRLPDNGLCTGPDLDGINCIRHIASLMGFDRVSSALNALPDKFIASLSRMTGKAWWPEKRLSPSFHFLAVRKDFVMKRVNRIDRVLVPTRFMEKILVRNGLNEKLTMLIPFGINMDPFKDLSHKKHDKRPVFGIISTLAEHKGVHILIDAVKRLPKTVDFHVRIYGNIDEKSDYSSRLLKTAEGEERIEFCGTFPNDKIGEILSSMDALVVPSIWYENTPLVIYSAQAAGIPVIGTNVGGISEVVHHGENGLLFDIGDSVGLSELLKRAAEDRALLGRLSGNVSPPLSITAYVDSLEEIYGDVLGKRKTRQEKDSPTRWGMPLHSFGSS